MASLDGNQNEAYYLRFHMLIMEAQKMQHKSDASLEQQEFESSWNILEKAMVNLGTSCGMHDVQNTIKTMQTITLEMVTPEMKTIREQAMRILKQYQEDEMGRDFLDNYDDYGEDYDPSDFQDDDCDRDYDAYEHDDEVDIDYDPSDHQDVDCERDYDAYEHNDEVEIDYDPSDHQDVDCERDYDAYQQNDDVDIDYDPYDHQDVDCDVDYD